MLRLCIPRGKNGTARAAIAHRSKASLTGNNFVSRQLLLLLLLQLATHNENFAHNSYLGTVSWLCLAFLDAVCGAIFCNKPECSLETKLRRQQQQHVAWWHYRSKKAQSKNEKFGGEKPKQNFIFPLFFFLRN